MDLSGKLQHCKAKDVRRLAKWLGLKNRSLKAVEKFLEERSSWPPPVYERKW